MCDDLRSKTLVRIPCFGVSEPNARRLASKREHGIVIDHVRPRRRRSSQSLFRQINALLGHGDSGILGLQTAFGASTRSMVSSDLLFVVRRRFLHSQMINPRPYCQRFPSLRGIGSWYKELLSSENRVDVRQFMQAARGLMCTKDSPDPHDFKYPAAPFDDAFAASPD